MWRKRIKAYFKKRLWTRAAPFLLLISILLLTGCEETRDDLLFGTVRIPADTEQYRELMAKACLEEGIPEYENLLMAIMAVESSGSGVTDVMQCSESLGLPRNSLNVEESIRQGVRYFKSLLEKAGRIGADLKSTIQAYNFGGGFLDYAVKENSGQYTEELAVDYSDRMKQKYQSKVYGNPFYVSAVSKYISFMGTNEGDAAYEALMEAALPYEGAPYVFGGTTPSGFDCSGFTRYVYGKIGIHLPRTAQEQYSRSTHITADEARPGDLIFFTKTYKTSVRITHVGIYTGSGQMFHAGGSRVGYTSIHTAYWSEHFAGFGRVW